MRLKVVSDGTPSGSRVVDAWTGETVEGVECVELKISAMDVPRATFHCVSVPVEIEAGELKRYELRNDGAPQE